MNNWIISGYFSLLQRLSKQLCRKQKGSNNYVSAKNKLAKLHAHIANLRKDTLHKITTYLMQKPRQNSSRRLALLIENMNLSHAKTQRRKVTNKNKVDFDVSYPDSAMPEDLNVSGMVKNHKLSQSISDCSFYEFRRQLEYKCKKFGSTLIIASRFYPSSKTCSNCGHKKSVLKLSQRIFDCDNCGFSLDRDLNAAINLKALGCSV